MPEEPKPDRAHERSQQRGSQSSPENVPEEVRYDLGELREHATLLLGVSPATVAGATFSERRKSLTLNEAKAAVTEFLARPEEKDPATVEAES